MFVVPALNFTLIDLQLQHLFYKFTTTKFYHFQKGRITKISRKRGIEFFLQKSKNIV